MSVITQNTSQVEWEEDHSYPSGTMTKVLRDEGAMRVFLLKLPPGFRMDAHTHVFGEQHFVLEGEYESGGTEHGPGTYEYIPAHCSHGPYTIPKGAVILVIWEGSALLNVGV